MMKIESSTDHIDDTSTTVSEPALSPFSWRSSFSFKFDLRFFHDFSEWTAHFETNFVTHQMNGEACTVKEIMKKLN